MQSKVTPLPSKTTPQSGKSPSNCSNCGKPLGELIVATPDLDPRHGYMCPTCAREILDSGKEWEKGPYGDIARLKDPLEMFDLCVAGSFMAGQLGGKIPVDNTRKVFDKVKELLLQESREAVVKKILETPTNNKESCDWKEDLLNTLEQK